MTKSTDPVRSLDAPATYERSGTTIVLPYTTPVVYDAKLVWCAECGAAKPVHEHAGSDACGQCGEAPRGNDPGMSNGICCFCGYWGVPPGPEREAIRARRAVAPLDEDQTWRNGL